jgi:hypothetical protein
MNFLGLLVESYGTWLLLQRLVDASKDSDIPKNVPFAFAINNRNINRLDSWGDRDVKACRWPPTLVSNETGLSKEAYLCLRCLIRSRADSGVVGCLCRPVSHPGLPCPDPACGGRGRPAEAESGPHCGAQFGRSRTGQGSSRGRKGAPLVSRKTRDVKFRQLS